MKHHQTVERPRKGSPSWWAVVWSTSLNFKLQILISKQHRIFKIGGGGGEGRVLALSPPCHTCSPCLAPLPFFGSVSITFHRHCSNHDPLPSRIGLENSRFMLSRFHIHMHMHYALKFSSHCQRFINYVFSFKKTACSTLIGNW